MVAKNLDQHHFDDQLHKDRTEGYRLFQVVGVDFAGLITYKIKEKKEGKAYIILSCGSFPRALEILKDQTLMELFEKSPRTRTPRRRTREYHGGEYHGGEYHSGEVILNE